MQRRLIHRGGILSAGYDQHSHRLDIEFDTKRVLRYDNIGFEIADRFLNCASPFHYWQDEIEENYTGKEISPQEAFKATASPKKNLDELKKLFGDL